MKYTIEKIENFQIIGFEKDVTADQAFSTIPQFFNETMTKINHLHIPDIGMYSITINDPHDANLIHYYIAGPYSHDIPGLITYRFDDSLWVKFSCHGPYPYALQKLNYEIYSRWFPDHPQYQLADDISIEYLTDGNRSDPHYYSELWLPIHIQSQKKH